MLHMSRPSFVQKYGRVIELAKERNLIADIPTFPYVDEVVINTQVETNARSGLNILFRQRGQFAIQNMNSVYKIEETKGIELLFDHWAQEQNPDLTRILERTESICFQKVQNWDIEEWKETTEYEESIGWKDMSQKEWSQLWPKVDAFLQISDEFKIIPPKPSIQIDLTPMYNAEESRSIELETDFTEKFLRCTQKATEKDEKILSFCGTASSAYLDPKGGIFGAFTKSWPISPISRGLPYYVRDTPTYFLAEDFRFGLANTWKEDCLWIFGQSLIDKMIEEAPLLLQKNVVLSSAT